MCIEPVAKSAVISPPYLSELVPIVGHVRVHHLSSWDLFRSPQAGARRDVAALSAYGPPGGHLHRVGSHQVDDHICVMAYSTARAFCVLLPLLLAVLLFRGNELIVET